MSKTFLLCLIVVSAALVFLSSSASAPVQADGTRDFSVVNEIDKLVLKRLQEEKIEPSVRCTDEEFIRRVYLDVCGVIPTRAEVKAFLADHGSDKRAKLIDQALRSDRYADHFAILWGDLLREHSQSKPREGTERGSYRDWLQEAFAKNIPYNEFAKQLITARGNPEENPAVNFYLRDEQDRVETSNTVSTVFMGTRMACAQCHDHPFDKWTQDDFHGLMAFFGRTQVFNDPTDTMLRVEKNPRLFPEAKKLLEPYFKEAHDADEKRKLKGNLDGGGGEGMGMMGMLGMMGKGKKFLDEIDKDLTKEQAFRIKQIFQQSQIKQVADRKQGDYHMPTEGDGKNKKGGGQVVEPRFPWDPSRKSDTAASRRADLANFVTGSHQFAMVQCNRLWANLMGRGLVDPTDDFRPKNQPVNPDLLDFLAEEFVRSNFDNKHMLRLMLNSSTYQRSSVPNSTNRSDTTLNSHQRLRRMSAEQIFDSMLVAVGFEGGLPPQNQAEQAAKRRSMFYGEGGNQRVQWAVDLPTPAPNGSFMNVFNQPSREQTVVKRDESGSISQALEMLNGDALNKAIRSSPLIKSLVDSHAGPNQIADELYLSVLARYPAPAELSTLNRALASKALTHEVLEDLQWALLNTREFTFIR